MKKRMLIAFALIAILATSAFAADFGWGGCFTTVWSVALTEDTSYAGMQFGSFFVNAKLDDNNAVNVEMIYADDGVLMGLDSNVFNEGQPDLQIAQADLSTDIFGALGFDLPVSLAMHNGYGRLNIHDRFNGEGMGWNFKTFKDAGALDNGWGRYLYTGFDLGIMDLVNVRLYTAPGSWNSHGVNFLVDAWAPIAIADIMTLDIGAWFVLNGQANKIVFGYKVKADMSFGIVAIGVWLGGTVQQDNFSDGTTYEKEITTLAFTEAVNAKFNFTDAMGLKIAVGSKQNVNAYSGSRLTSYNNLSDDAKKGDLQVRLAADLAFNYASFVIYGGVMTNDLNVVSTTKSNATYDFGIGYGFGAVSMKIGMSGSFLTDRSESGFTQIDGYIDGVGGITANCTTNIIGQTLVTGNKNTPVLYFMAGAWF